MTADTDLFLSSLASLSQVHRSIHEARIKREFTLVISLVSFYLASIAARFSTVFNLPASSWPFRIQLWLSFAVLAFAAVIYLRRSGKANDFNQALAEAAEKAIIARLREAKIDLLKEVHTLANQTGLQEQDEKKEKRHPNKDRWRWQAAIIIFAGVSASLAIAFG